MWEGPPDNGALMHSMGRVFRPLLLLFVYARSREQYWIRRIAV
jgi:hypothetical protein